MTRTPRFLPLAFVSALALATPMTLMPSISFAQDVGVSITLAPPPLPVYVQPPIPAPDYIFVPGYWAWDGPDGYYWVPATWVQAPEPGLLWTPGYWAWADGGYLWRAGYWGPEVGFYGGIDYGFGYTGSGYYGGRWDHDHFFYNRSVNNFGGTHITNVFNERVPAAHASRVSFNGGRGGLTARPSAQQQALASQHHVDPTSTQTAHEHAAAGNHALFANVNHGRPAVAATSHPSSFSGAGVAGARNAATFHPAAATTAGGGAAPGATPRNAGARPDNRAAGAQPGSTPSARAPNERANVQGGATARPNAAPAAHVNAAPQAHTPQAQAPRAQVTHQPQPQQHARGPAGAPAAPHQQAVRPASAPRPAPHQAPHPAPAVRPAAAPHPAPHPAAPHAAPAAHPAEAPHPADPHDEHH